MATFLGFALCAAAFLLLAVLSVTSWRRVSKGSGLTLAFLVQAVWSAAVAADAAGRGVSLVWLVTLEIARAVCWAAVLTRALWPVLRATAPVPVVSALAAVAVALPAVALLAPFWTSGESLRTFLMDLLHWSGLLLSIAGLVLVEQFARNARRDLRWELRYLWLGIGILFANDLAIWSMSLLLGSMDGLPYDVRSTINAVVAVLLGVALRRVPDRVSANLLSSSGTLFFNSTLVVTGVYVMLMAGASVMLRERELGSRSFVEALFIGASLVVLAVALFSSQFRAWTRVTLSKLLLPYRYDYRDVWLTLTRDLSDASDVPVRRRVAMSLASFVNSGFGQIWERDGEVYRPADNAQRTGRPPSIAHEPFYDFMRDREWIFDVAAWRESEGTQQMPEISPGVRPTPPAWLRDDPTLWLLVPLISNHQIVGLAALDKAMAPTTLGWEQLDLLRAAGRQIGSYLAFDQAANRLAEMHQFEALNRLSGFVMHDLRHLVAQLALVVDNAARHRRNPEFIDDAILTIDSSVKRMTSLMDALRSGVVSEPDRRVDVAELLREVVARLRDRAPVPELVIEACPAEVMANRDRIEQALEHLVRNAQDATPPDGKVAVTLVRAGQNFSIEIADTGCGMDEEFLRSRLFKPFESTKGQAGMGLGAYEAREIVRKHGGTMIVQSSPGKGTVFRIALPSAPTVTP